MHFHARLWKKNPFPRMRVCIVGAGVAGLQAADHLARDGHECVVFDKGGDVGGVWRENYDGFGLQVPSELYEFPGMPVPARDGSFPAGAEVQRYIRDFVAHTDLARRCSMRFDEEVRKVTRLADGTWSVRTAAYPITGEYVFDYVVVATGMYHLPHVPAPWTEDARAVHSSKFLDASVVTGKRVVVVGGGKSAIDCAVEASKHSDDVTLYARALHWPVPRRILGLVPFQWGTYSRLGHFLLYPPHWTSTHWMHAACAPLKRAVWSLLERIFAWQFAVHPDTPLILDLFHGGQILDYQFRDAVRDGRIKVRPTPPPDADVVVCGTGFTKSYEIFDAETRARLDVQDDGLWLYHNLLPPRVPGLAFVGSEVSTFNNILTHHVQSRWLAHALRTDALPSPETMEAHVEKERRWKRSWMADTPSRAALLQLHMTRYHDLLCADMDGLRPASWFHKWLAPLTARMYAHGNA